jgi:DNA-binding transcriptional MerR regulator/methylmalonyl-CoA mutase cobalamin-binding subunit
LNDLSIPITVRLSIAAVERDTGLSKDTLRVWERRYGFPTPQRDAVGERAYSIDQVEKLRLIKRLMDAGHRPGRIVPLPIEELLQLSSQTVDHPQRSVELAQGSAELRANLALIRSHDITALRHHLMRLLARFGVGRFVTEIVAPLNVAVGDAWMRGQMEVFEEHAYIEVVQNVLRTAIAAIPTPGPSVRAPRVLLTTFPGEQHGMGLLMAEAILTLEGCQCVSLGVQTPLWDTVLAAKALSVDIVALSFTACLNPNLIVDGLGELRTKLPHTTQLWVGGSAPALYRRSVAGVLAFNGLEQLPTELLRWRQGQVGL